MNKKHRCHYLSDVFDDSSEFSELDIIFKALFIQLLTLSFEIMKYAMLSAEYLFHFNLFD